MLEVLPGAMVNFLLFACFFINAEEKQLLRTRLFGLAPTAGRKPL